MSIRQESIISAVDRANNILNFNIHNTIIQCELVNKIINDNKSLTKAEKKEAIKIINQHYDHCKIVYNEGTRIYNNKENYHKDLNIIDESTEGDMELFDDLIDTTEKALTL
ncbi:hypothetical protein RhiirC2_793719 [Rhizophagus irregularis]|uniref:Uncharacterized protein n=1 Tax=Rhizophagus irregularis TaxID=588596 RepID=A0A2N1MEW0_9GLOM|nr:hypothetical protein RhiirC2_793719 [Rhizophagus irregularis]